MFTTNDYKIVKIEKKADVTKTVTSWQTLDQNGVHYNNSESYDTKLSSLIYYENGDTDIIDEDLEVTEGWTVRFVFLDNEITYKICVENNLILFAKKNPDLIGTKVDFKKHPFFGDFVSPLKSESEINEELSYEYNIPGLADTVVLYAKDKQVINSEKISIIEKTGKTIINTRVYYDDNTSELFENKELAILPGWHVREIYYQEKNAKGKITPKLRKIWESNETLFKASFPDNAYHFVTNRKYHPMIMKDKETVEKTKKPYNFFLFIFWLLLFGSIAGFIGAGIMFEDQFEEVNSIKTLIMNFLFMKGVPSYCSIAIYVFVASILGIILISNLKKIRKQKIKAMEDKTDNDFDEWKKANKTILRKVYDDYIKLSNEEDGTKKKQ